MLHDPIPPAARVIDLLSGSFVAQAVYVAAKLGIADHLAAGPVTAARLARDLAVDEMALTRVLRLLVAEGVFRREASGEFANTPLSETLATGGDDSLRDLAVWWCEEPHWRVFGHLLESVRTGLPAWPVAHGTELFPYLTEVNPLALDMVVPDSDARHFSKVCDIEMLLAVRGRERTPEEFACLFTAAGLRLARVVPTASVVSLIEAVPEGGR